MFIITIGVVYLLTLFILKVKQMISTYKCSSLRVAFLHPFCNDGGGGQKVLWCMIQALMQLTDHQVAIYSLEKNKQEILSKTKNRFNIDLSNYRNRLSIININGKYLLSAHGNLTMLLHLLLPPIYVLKCIWIYQPNIFYDTTGYSSTLILVKLLLPMCKTITYIHYPFISTDMIDKVQKYQIDFNNNSNISKSYYKTKLKLLYYKIIYFLYKINKYFISAVQVNSSWTQNHMLNIWSNIKIQKLYPPCNVKNLIKNQKNNNNNNNQSQQSLSIIQIISLAQFRPEKQQLQQIQIIHQCILKLKNTKIIKFNICGTTRNSNDQIILQQLKDHVKELKIQPYVHFHVNKSYNHIEQLLSISNIGLHTMKDQHFGISIVEMLASGQIVIAHNSAGPKIDLIQNQLYLAQTTQQYVSKIINVIHMNINSIVKIQSDNQIKAKLFSQEEFMSKFINIFQKIVTNSRKWQ